MVRRSLKLLTFNVRSLREKSRQIDTLNILIRNNIEIGFIQETHLRQNRKICINGYNFINDNTGVGVAIVIKNTIQYKRVFPCDFDLIGVFIQVDIRTETTTKSLLIGSIYIPTNCPSVTLSDGLNKILNLAKSYDAFIFGGDLNAKNPVWGDTLENSNGKILYTWLQDNSVDVARKCDSSPSYPNGSSFLDHFLISPHLLNHSSINFNIRSLPSFSDHFPLELSLQLGQANLILRQPRNFRSYKNINWNNFRHEMEIASNRIMPPTNRNLVNEEIDIFLQQFNTTFAEIHNTHSEQVPLLDKKMPLPSNIKHLFNISHGWQKELKKIYHRTGNRLSREYSILSKQLQLLKTLLKELVALNDAKQFGSRLKKIVPGPTAFKEISQMMSKKSSFCQQLCHNGVITTNTVEIAEHFRSFYSNVFLENIPGNAVANLDSRVSVCMEGMTQHIYTFDDTFCSNENSDSIHFTDADKVRSIIGNLKNKKSSGCDEISNFIIRKFPETTIDFLTILYNNCINNCYFPAAWKFAKIVPIKKKEGSNVVGDFRPISLLSNVGKVFECILKEKLENCYIIDPIPSFQFGFRKQHSTQHALLKFHSDVCGNLRKEVCTVAISLDIEKAFDSVFHKGILYKLVEVGTDPYLVKMLQSYFSERKFNIQILDSMSSPGSVSSGVPQGSVLAPFLFNIFLHDFPHQSGESTAILYADDCLIYAHDCSPVQALQKATFHLGKISEYYKKWGIKINAAKSEAICIRNASGKCPRYVVPQSKSLQLTLDGIDIPFKSSLKYLGINFNKLFRFNNHARTALAKSKRICGMFSSLLNSKYLPENTKLLLYKVAIRPILIYGFPIWFAISPLVAKELEIHERKILRKCINKHFENPTKRFSNAYIYDSSKVTPFCKYAMALLEKFVQNLRDHDNNLMNEVLWKDEFVNWSAFPYISPIGILTSAELVNCVDPHTLPNFYGKVALGSHRG